MYICTVPRSTIRVVRSTFSTLFTSCIYSHLQSVLFLSAFGIHYFRA
nr:MAG TPA: hypothetical protein [Caudoviricetes sp.]